MASLKSANTSPSGPQIREPLPGRTRQHDREALAYARSKLDHIRNRRDRYRGNKVKGTSNSLESGGDVIPEQITENGDDLLDESHEDLADRSESQPTSAGSRPVVTLPLISLDEFMWRLPEKDLKPGAKCVTDTNIGFPDDRSLDIKELDEIHIDIRKPSVAELAQDIIDIKTKPAAEIADRGDINTNLEYNRTIESFQLRGRSVTKIKFSDADVYKKESPFYGKLQTSKQFEKKIKKGLEDQPSLDIERYVIAQMLLCQAGKIGGREEAYWRTARGMAQQQLYINADLSQIVRRQQSRTKEDPALEEMLEIVEKGILKKGDNPYHKAQRDEYAIENGLFYQVKSTEIVMVLDKADNVIVFQFSDSFRELLSTVIQEEVLEAFETYSTLQPVPVPDATRHGLHWVQWLKERPYLDFRNSENDPRKAKSGVYHFGGRCQTGDAHGDRVPIPTRDSGKMVQDSAYISQQLEKLRYNALGACTEIIRFFFNILDPELLKKYQDVAAEVEKIGENPEEIGLLKKIPFQTRRSRELFLVRALLVNVMTNQHKDKGDWKHGFACLVPVGEYTGGDLLLQELGLQIEAPPGCVQLMRGRELTHSISKWKGRRFVVVHVTHEPVRQWAERKMNLGVAENAIVEKDLGEEDGDNACCAESSASLDNIPAPRKMSKGRAKRAKISLDASDEEGKDKQAEPSHKKAKKGKGRA